MIASIVYFEQALASPERHFKQLRNIVAIRRNNRIAINCTRTTFEAEVMWNDRHYMLFLPLEEERIRHIEELELIAKERSRGPLIENHIFYDEMSIINSTGQRHSYTIVLQEIPKSISLRQAALRYKSEDLLDAIHTMKSRLDAIGFRHNNLTPSNIIICESGKARPLRYWYAEWEVYSNNNISKLEEFINIHNIEGLSSTRESLIKSNEEEYHEPLYFEGIARKCRGGRYGFVDLDGVQVAPYIYSLASNFREGRAIVAKNNKMGAIDNNGAKVIPVIYKTLEFDIDTGIFTATNDKYRYYIDYNGHILRREIFEGGGFSIAAELNRK